MNDDPAMNDDAGQWSAVAEWYHAFFTGLVMTMVTRRSVREAADLVFHVFRRQHLERFLPGLRKLGLDPLPPAVAAARYHYLSNAIGGVHVEYMEESDRKAWVRYPPPRWAWHGTALCAIPGEVSRAMLLGWHAHNGVSLGNRRLGFVCTKQTMDGQPGLEGYYCEFDHDLEPDERLRFARGEEAPDFDAAAAPRLPSTDWPLERIQKARRNYAMEYVRTALPELIALVGPVDGAYLGGLTGRLIGMQFHAQTAAALLPDTAVTTDATAAERLAATAAVANERISRIESARRFARFMVTLAHAQGDRAEIVDASVMAASASPAATGDTVAGAAASAAREEVIVRQHGWKLMSGLSDLHPAVFDAWNGLLEGALSAHDRHLALQVTRRLDQGDTAFEWRIRPVTRVRVIP